MTWSYDQNLLLYLVVAAGLAALLVIDFGFAATRARRREPGRPSRGLHGRSCLDLAQPQSRENGIARPGPKPPAVFLIDESRSMSLEAPASRAEAAERLIKGAEHWWPLARLRRSRSRVRPRAVCDCRAASRPGARWPTKPGSAGLCSSSLLGSSETAAAWRVRLLGRPLDGARTARFDREGFAELGVPVHVVPLGDERISGDVAVAGYRRAARRAAGNSRADAGDPAQPGPRRRARPNCGSGRKGPRTGTCWRLCRSPSPRRAGARPGRRG